MKKILIISIFTLLGFYSGEVSGQKTVVEIEMKAGKAQNVFTTGDSFGNIAYIFQGTKSIQVSIFDATYAITKEFLVDRDETEKKNAIIGAVLNEKSVVVYLYDGKERNFSSLVINRFDGTYVFNSSIGTLNKTEFILKSFEMEGAFYTMVVPQYKNTVLLFVSKEGENFAIKTYEIGFPTLYAKLSTKNDELNQKTEGQVGIEKIGYTIENNVKSTYPTKKLYMYGNKIYMTFDEPSHTHLVIIDPAKDLATYRKLNFTLDKSKEKIPRQGNSFLYKGDLFRITMSKDQMNLLVVNLDSMQMLKSYNMFPGQPITFINGQMIEDGNDIQERVVKGTQQYFKKVDGGNLAVAVNELNSEEYQVEVGAYEEVVNYRGSGMGGYPISPGLSIGMGMGVGMGVGIGMGGMGMGGYPGGFYDPFYSSYPGYYPYGSGYSSTSIRAVYFQSLMRINDLEHLEGNLPKTMREKISDYEDNTLNKGTLELLTIIRGYNGVLFGYYSKGRSRYNIVEFK